MRGPAGLDEDIAKYGDENVFLCTDDYGIYNEIEDYSGIDGQMTVITPKGT